jgi:hypothetical protein
MCEVWVGGSFWMVGRVRGSFTFLLKKISIYLPQSLILVKLNSVGFGGQYTIL